MTDEHVAAAFQVYGAENEPVRANQPISLETSKTVLPTILQVIDRTGCYPATINAAGKHLTDILAYFFPDEPS